MKRRNHRRGALEEEIVMGRSILLDWVHVRAI